MTIELINNNSSRISNFFDSLETQKNVLTTCTDLYKTITTHFSSVQQALTERSQALDSKIEAFDIHVKKTRNSLSERENAIPELESSLAAHIAQKKELAISELKDSAETTPTEVNGEFLEMVGLYCRRMDVISLFRCLLMRKKDTTPTGLEIVGKMVDTAVDVLTLVLDGVVEFVKMKEAKVGLADKLWACGLLVEGLFDLGGEYGVKGVKGVAVNVAERAFLVLEKWKKLAEREDGYSSGMGPAEAVMFLQILVVLGLIENFEVEYLKNLVMEFATRRGMAKIAQAMKFGEKIEVIIDEMAKTGREIEAIYFACESGLTDRFPPLTLLKSYLRTSRTNATAVLKEGNYNAAATDEASMMELNSIKAIIKCVEDHKLESEFPLESLRKRVPQLEKSKAERRSGPSSGKPSHKRADSSMGAASGGGGSGNSGWRSLRSSRPLKSARYSNDSPSFGHQSPAAGRYLPPTYNYPSQNVYQAPPTSSYGMVYGGPHSHSQSPAALAQQFSLTAQDTGAPIAGAGTASYGGPYDYSAYDYTAAAAVAAAAAPSAYPTYQQ